MLSGEADAGNGHCMYVASAAKNIRVSQSLCVAQPDVKSSHCLHVYHGKPAADEVAFHDNVCVNFTIGVGIYSGAINIRVRNQHNVKSSDKGAANECREHQNRKCVTLARVPVDHSNENNRCGNDHCCNGNSKH